MKQELLHQVVGHEDVRESVAIVVIDGDTHALTFGGSDPGRNADVAESSVAFIVEEQVCGSLVFGNPDTSYGGGNFGRITGTKVGARNAQISLKYLF